MKLFNNTMEAIERTMDQRIRRHTLLTSNVANSETPNYRARDMDFGAELEKILNKQPEDSLVKTSEKHMDTARLSEAHVILDNEGAMGADGNNVDLDLAMGKLSENSRAYQSAVNLLGVELRLIKNAARGRSA